MLLILSRIFLKTRYRIIHYIAVCACLAGVGTMVGADLLSGRDQGSSKNTNDKLLKDCTVKCFPNINYVVLTSTARNVLLGDGLVIISATLYAISNLCQEYTVKNKSRVEFLGMLGLFGMLISGIQLWESFRFYFSFHIEVQLYCTVNRIYLIIILYIQIGNCLVTNTEQDVLHLKCHYLNSNWVMALLTCCTTTVPENN